MYLLAMNWDRANSVPWFVGVAVLLASFALYLSTLAPTLTWGTRMRWLTRGPWGPRSRGSNRGLPIAISSGAGATPPHEDWSRHADGSRTRPIHNHILDSVRIPRRD